MRFIVQASTGGLYVVRERSEFPGEHIYTTFALVAQMARLVGARDASGLEILLGEGDSTSWLGGRAQGSVMLVRI